jgi:hypothetical protein
VRAGSNFYKSGGTTSSTIRYLFHPLFNYVTLDYDVGVINLDSNPLPLNNSTIKAVKLAEEDSTVPDGSVVTVTGWGTTSVIYNAYNHI